MNSKIDRVYLVGIIKARSLSKYNETLGHHYDAIFEEQCGSAYAIKYSNSNITPGYKHIISRFQIQKHNNKQTFIFDNNSACCRYNKLSIQCKLFILIKKQYKYNFLLLKMKI
jgi:hypothetical protein